MARPPVEPSRVSEDIAEDFPDVSFDFGFEDSGVSDNKTAFFEKIALRLFSRFDKSYAYERLFGQMVLYQGQLFRGTGTWAANLVAKQAAYKKKRNETSKVSAEFDIPVYPNDYLERKDVEETVGHITSHRPDITAPFKIDATVETLGDLLELNETERLILQFCIYSGSIPYPYEQVMSPVLATSDFNEAEKLFSTMLGLNLSDVENALKGFLFSSGLIVPSKRSPGLYVVTPEMSETFADPNLTEASLGKALFPSCIQTELTVESYPHLSTEIARAESIIERSLANKAKGINLMFWGLAGTGKTELALALAKKHGWDLKVIGDSSNQDMNEKSRAQRLTSLKIAMKLYQNGENVVLLFDEIEDLFKTDNNATFSKAFINRIIETTPVPIIWTTNDLFSLGAAVLRRMTYNIGFEIPGRAARKTIWEGYAKKHGVELDEKVIDELASNYDIVPALIGNAVKIAKMADLREQEDVADIVKSLDRLVNFGYKRKFEPIKMREDTPYDTRWVNTKRDLGGLTEKILNAKPSFKLCLYGPSGTGKSEYGRYLAKRLGKRILFKRASDLQSPFLGVTEQLIAGAFEEAKKEEMILLIDEGDTFLRSRKLARTSWEVSQVNEMLSQMETNEQPFVLSTNLMQDIDVAALRRFTFKMEFRYLRPEQAVEMFEAYFGAKAPSSIAKLDILTPGDFAAVKDRADITGDTDPDELCEMLREELELKEDFNKTVMGFGR